MYQLLDFNVDYLVMQQQPVYLVGTDKEAVKAYKRIFIRSIQLGRFFRLEGVYSLDKEWFGRKYCSVIVRDLEDGEKPEGVYLVAENDYSIAKKMIDILSQGGIGQIIVTLPVLQFPLTKEQFEQNRKLFFENRKKIQYVYERLEENKSKRIWKKLLQARWDSGSNRDVLYREAMELSGGTGSKQYFPVGEIFKRPEKEGIFIDGGALSGSSAVEYAQWCKNNYSKIYSFEPDIRYHNLLETNICCHHLERVEIMDVGLYDHMGMEDFYAEPLGSSKVGCGKRKVPVVTIDDLLYDEKVPVTYIKMDIEGSECKALDGAKQIIKRDYPKLAICIYHGEKDIFEVPYKIMKEFDYTQIYIRHYSDMVGESVVYAVR